MKSKKRMACAALSVFASFAVAAGALPAVLAADTTSGTAIVESAVTTYDLSENSSVKIKEDGVYRITGSSEEGSITVAKDVTATIILDNATLGSSTTAPIVCKAGSNVTIEVVGTSTLTNAEDIANEESDDFEGAVIKAKSNATLTISGDGTLNLNGSTKNGIKGATDATITIESGTLNITAANDAVNSSADLNVTGGTLNITAADDALHADGTLTVGTEGSENGLTINIISSYEGLEGAQVILNSGTGYVRASDDGVNAASDENGTIGITVNGGDWYVNADGDGLDAGGESNLGNGSIYLNGGTVTVYGAANNGNGALDSESVIVYNGGTLIAVGMSGMAEVPSGTNVLVFGSAGMGGGMMGGMPGQMVGNARNGQQAPQFGQSQQNSNAPTMPGNNQGGTFGPQMGGNMPSGGQMPGMNGMQNGPMGQQSGNVTITEGSTIVITDSSGNVIYEATGVKDANSVVFASDDLTAGETYTLSVDGKEVATTTAGANSGAPMGGMNGPMNGQQNGMPGQTQQNGQQAPQLGQNQQNGQQAPQFGQNQQNGQQAPQLGQNQQNGQQPPQLGQNQQNGQQPPQFDQNQQNGQQAPQFGQNQQNGQRPQMGNQFGSMQPLPQMGGMPGGFSGQMPMMGNMNNSYNAF